MNDSLTSLRPKSKLKRFSALREIFSCGTSAQLNNMLGLRATGISASIADLTPNRRYVSLKAYRDSRPTVVKVGLDYCIACCFPEASDFAWGTLGEAQLFDLLSPYDWKAVIPGPDSGWDSVALQGIGFDDETSAPMIAVQNGGETIFYSSLPQFRGGMESSWSSHEWLPLPARVEIGSTALTRRVLRSLRPGDVLRIAKPSARLWLAEHKSIPLAFIDGVLVVQDKNETHGLIEKGRSPDPASIDSAWDLGYLPIELSFSLHTIELTVGQLAALRPGDVLRFGVGAADDLRVLANGKLAAKAELVEVAGELAAEIKTLNFPSP